MSKNLLDNGTVLTLGLVGAVAAIGVATKRGVYGSRATATQNVMERLRSQLNGQGFSFELEDDYLIVDDGASVSIVAVDSPLRPDAQGPYRPGVDDAFEPTMVEVAKRKLDRNGNLVSMKILGEFPVASVSEIAAAIRGGARGSRSTGPTDAELRAVGRYTKSVNPDEKKYAREAGHGTGDLAIGKYVYSHYDEDSFAELLDHVREQGMVKTGKGSRAKRAETFSVGDKVKHKREFLRSIGWMTNVPRNGVVRSVTDGFSGRQLLEVAWSDGTTSKIISPNVTHAGKVELF